MLKKKYNMSMTEDNHEDKVKQTVTENVLNKVTGVDEQEIREYVSEKVEEYLEHKVTDPNAITPEVVNRIQKDLGAEVEGSEETAQFVEIEEVVNGNFTEEWVSVRGEVIDLWDNDSDSIHQVGRISDGTPIKFTIWSQEDLDTYLEQDSQYELKNVIVKEHEGNYEVQVQPNSEINKVDLDIDVNETVEFHGDVVKLYETSGLIKRDEDGRVAQEGENDLRLKMAVDNGEEVQTVIVGKELTEQITGITLNEAVELARDKLDISVVYNKMKEELILQHVKVEGVERGEYLFSSKIQKGELPVENVKQKASELLMKMGDKQ